jgi:hypothetical protein
MLMADVAQVPGLDFFADAETRLLALLGFGAALLLCLAAIVLVALRLLRKQPTALLDQQDELAIDVAALPTIPPPKEGEQLEFFGTPVRLAVMVLAPVGRGGDIPAPAELAMTLENLLPGLQGIVSRHQPRIVLWPNQLSSQGFLQAFFNLAALPGDHGKGTPWCSAAGKFEGGGQQYLAGLICCAAGPNSLGEMTVDKPGQWLSVLRVRAA